MKCSGNLLILIIITLIVLTACAHSKDLENGVWTEKKANAWYKEKGWRSGCNYIPATSINTIEMWQKESFDSFTIDRELGWAHELGFNTMRVFLNSLVWKADRDQYKKRIDKFLTISASHGIATIFVFFDDCWNEESSVGKQPDPKPGVHNSGWVQDPARSLRADSAKLFPVIESYVKDIISTFGNDDRVLIWDLYNEPGPASCALLKDVYRWARSVNPSQPITSGINNLSHIEINRFRLENSDVISYHNYDPPEEAGYWISFLKLYGRPLFCTEYLRRNAGSTFQTILPLLRQNNVSAINWGFVSGKTNTVFGWDDPKPDGKEPAVWFHDIMRKDKSPFDPVEITFIRKINTGIN